MQDYAKLRKLDDDELNQVSGGGGEQYNENGGGRDIGIDEVIDWHKCYFCGNKTSSNFTVCDKDGNWWCCECYNHFH